MRLSATRAPGHTLAGFTLVEVLVALAVLSVGLLGFASLALGGLRDSRTALHHTRAIDLCADLAERIRANRRAAIAYALAEGTAIPAPAADCSVAGECSATDLAAFDLYAWQQEALAALPEPVGSVVVTATGGAVICAIRLQWTATGSERPASVELVLQV